MTIDLDAFKARWTNAYMRKQTHGAMERILRRDVPRLVREVERLRERISERERRIVALCKENNNLADSCDKARLYSDRCNELLEAFQDLLNHATADVDDGWRDDLGIGILEYGKDLAVRLGLAERHPEHPRLFRWIKKEGASS